MRERCRCVDAGMYVADLALSLHVPTAFGVVTLRFVTFCYDAAIAG